MKNAEQIKNMKVVIGNDDGINTPGILLLEKISQSIFTDVTVLVPRDNKSGVSHSITLNYPFRVTEYADKHYAISGSPVDSLIFGLRYLFQDKPNLVISGINSDANISEDIIYSGTVAVAREACLFGVPSMSLSQQKNHDNVVDWAVAEKFAPVVIKCILENYQFVPKVFLSINFPGVDVSEVKGIKVVRQGARQISDKVEKRIDPRGLPYYWIGAGEYQNSIDISKLDSDLGAIYHGYITVLPIKIDTTAYEQMDDLQKVFTNVF